MIGVIGGGKTQAELDEMHDDLEAFFAYVEDPECELDMILAVEEEYGVVHP
ncbi:DUF7215 family protein [Streptomyces sp. NRRL F-5123]|uniref:DUF7215 family protein n=1 Tax=Streptomyces sp. NRRL F-5123 TaxID=1463856 RepID=UPI000B1A40D8|nr:hypothetical protein [Streptomyces sp. NRRL F-5123]